MNSFVSDSRPVYRDKSGKYEKSYTPYEISHFLFSCQPSLLFLPLSLLLESQKAYSALAWGGECEWFAKLWLQLKGYNILARHYRVPQGEIDLIVQRGNTIAFVEVKARSTLEEAQNALTLQQRRRLAGAAAIWHARQADKTPWASTCHVRGDLMCFAKGRLRPYHIVDAFTLEK